MKIVELKQRYTEIFCKLVGWLKLTFKNSVQLSYTTANLLCLLESYGSNQISGYLSCWLHTRLHQQQCYEIGWHCAHFIQSYLIKILHLQLHSTDLTWVCLSVSLRLSYGHISLYWPASAGDTHASSNTIGPSMAPVNKALFAFA